MKNKIIILFVTLILLNMVINVHASEIKFAIDNNGNLKYGSSSSEMSNIGKAISFSMSSSQATGEDIKAIDKILPGSINSLGLNEETTGTKLSEAKNTIKNAIYNSVNSQFKSSLDSIDRLKNYAKNNFNGGFIEINDNVITLKKTDGSEYLKMPVGYSIDYDEKNRAGFSLKTDKYQTPKDSANVGGTLGYKVKLEKGSLLNINPDSYGSIKVELKGKGDIDTIYSSLKNIRDGAANIDKLGSIDYAKFTANEKNDYEFSYKDKKYKFNVQKEGSVLFDPKGESLKGEKASLIIGNDIKEFKEETRITADKWSILLENNIFKSINLNDRGEFIDSHNVLIELNPITDKEVNIFFDGKQHEGNYVSFGEKDLFAKTNDGQIGLEFKSNNPYTKIEENDFTSFNIYENSFFSIKNRDNQGLIPQAVAKGNFIIYNDQKEIYTNQVEDIFLQRTNGVTITSTLGHEVGKSISGHLSNSPFELTMLKSDGTPYLGNFKYEGEFVGSQQKSISGNKIFFDNSYRLAIAPLKSENIVSSYEGVDSEFSSRIAYNYPTKENIEILTGTSITFPKDIPEGNKEAVLVLLRDYYQNGISESMQDSVKSVNFYDQKDRPKIGGFVSLEDTSKVNLPWEIFNEALFLHESAHTLVFKITNSRNLESDDFDSEWSNVAGKYDKVKKIWGTNVYSDSAPAKAWTPDGQLQELTKLKESGDLLQSLHGYIRPYGGLNIQEDVATYVESIYSKPEIFNLLINPESPNYNPIYKQKLDLLYKYKFITPIKYQSILSGAGIK